MAGSVFFWEGVMKFVFPATLGVGRFTKLGIPFPDVMASFVGVVEMAGGVLLIAGLLTRVVAVPLLIDMVVAMVTTKIPLYLGTYPLAVVTLSSFPAPPAGQRYQVWVRWTDTWVSLGTAATDAAGNGRLIAEETRLATPPAAVEITLEPRAGSDAPTGPVVASWTR